MRVERAERLRWSGLRPATRAKAVKRFRQLVGGATQLATVGRLPFDCEKGFS